MAIRSKNKYSGRKCPKSYRSRKSYTRKSGKVVKSSCIKRKPIKPKLKCPSGYKVRKSYKRKNKKVRASCVKKSIKKLIKKIKEDLQECSSYSSKDTCESAFDKDNKYRRCRYNMTSKQCENLPEELRERATYGVGGSATYKKYEYKGKKLSKERLSPYGG